MKISALQVLYIPPRHSHQNLYHYLLCFYERGFSWAFLHNHHHIRHRRRIHHHRIHRLRRLTS